MQITESAANVILTVMSNNGLDPEKFLLNFESLDNGAMGFAFGRDNQSEWQEFYGLRVNVCQNMDNITVDLGEIEGRKGIIFLTENKNGN